MQFINGRGNKTFRYGPQSNVQVNSTVSSTHEVEPRDPLINEVSVQFLLMENRQLRQIIETEARERAREAGKGPGAWPDYLWMTAREILG